MAGKQVTREQRLRTRSEASKKAWRTRKKMTAARQPPRGTSDVKH